ncbi:MAG: sugar kinase [Amaricoccus sp.]
MLSIATPRVVAVGEAMLKLAPVGDGLYRRGFAGDTFNTVWHMARLLGHRATAGLVTRVGVDSLSDAFVAEMTADGLDVSGVARDPARGMGLYLIELDGAERSFHYWREASAARHLADDRGALAGALRGAGLIHLSGITLAILPPAERKTLFELVGEARDAGTLVAFDPNVRPRLWRSPEETREAVGRMLGLTDIALPSFDDEAAVWGDASPDATVARLASRGVREIVVKNGAGTIRLSALDRDDAIETPSVDLVRDTTGAGDAFNAGYLAARLLGCAPARAASVGQRLSAEVIRVPGARAPHGRIESVRRDIKAS